MNTIKRTLLTLLLLSSTAHSFISAMDGHDSKAKEMSNKDIIRGIKDFPYELKLHIISLVIQNTLYRPYLFKELPGKGQLHSLVFSPQGETILIACHTGLTLWSSITGELISAREKQTHEVYWGAFSPQGRMILNEPEDKTAFLWDAYSGTSLLRPPKGAPACAISVAFNPNGETVLTGSRNTIACLWDLKTGKIIKSFKKHTLDVLSVAFSPTGETVLTGSQDRTACLWNSTTGDLLKIFEGHTGSIRSVAFSHDGETILTGSDDTTACIWYSKTGKLIRTFTGHTKNINSVAFSPDGQTILTGSDDKTACLWNSKTGELITTLIGHPGSIRSAAFSPDGQTIVTGSWGEITDAGSWVKTACLWNSKTGELLTTLIGPSKPISSVAFSPDGNILATGASSNGTTHLWKSLAGFENLTQEEKERCFKLFMNYYPLLQRIEDTSKD